MTRKPTPRNQAAQVPEPKRDRSAVIAFDIDLAVVAFFAAFGRISHGLALGPAEFFDVAWPFAVGLAAAWLACLGWKRPYSVLRTGIPVWIGTLVIGMLLRYFVAGGGVSPVFVGVAAAFLALCFLGWRGIATFIRRRKDAFLP